MCKWCDDIYIQKESDSAFKRCGYKIEWCEKENGFFTIEDDCAYEHQINYCPWCGSKLQIDIYKVTKPYLDMIKQSMSKNEAVVLTQEGYDDLVKKYQDIEGKLQALAHVLMEERRTDMKRGLTQGEKEMYYEAIGESVGLR